MNTLLLLHLDESHQHFAVFAFYLYAFFFFPLNHLKVSLGEFLSWGTGNESD